MDVYYFEPESYSNLQSVGRFAVSFEDDENGNNAEVGDPVRPTHG